MKIALFLLVVALIASCYGQAASCKAAEELTNGVQVKGDTKNGQEYVACGEIPMNQVVFYKYTKTTVGPVTITLCGEETDFATTLFVESSCDFPECYDAPVTDFCGEQSVLTLYEVEFGATIIIGVGCESIGDIGCGGGEFQLKVYESDVVFEVETEYIPISEGQSILSQTLPFRVPLHICGYFEDFTDIQLFGYETLYSGSEITFSTCADYVISDMAVFFVDFLEGEPLDVCVNYVLQYSPITPQESPFCTEITVTGFPVGRLLYVAIPLATYYDSPTTRGVGGCDVIEVERAVERGILGEPRDCPVFLEVREPPLNDQCVDAFPVETNEEVTGTLRGATAQTSSCVDPNLSSGQMVYYTYTTASDTASILTFVCSPVESTIDIELHIFSSCDLGECVERFITCYDFPSMETGPNTQLIIGVTSQGFREGTFTFKIEEVALEHCNPEGPEYECATSFELETDHMCDGVQCVTITEEDLYLGYCFDYNECDCAITRVTGLEEENEPYITVGMELTSALPHYPVYSIATNENGVSTDVCSFRINVNDKCNPNGPELIPREQPVYVSTRSSCTTATGERCGIVPPFFQGICTDNKNCACSVYQIDQEFAPGSKLTKGTYQATIGARNELGFESEPGEVTIVVN